MNLSPQLIGLLRAASPFVRAEMRRGAIADEQYAQALVQAIDAIEDQRADASEPLPIRNGGPFDGSQRMPAPGLVSRNGLNLGETA